METSEQPLVSGLAHVCFTVADLERSVAFYCDVLGLRRAFDFLRPTGEWFGQYIHVGGRSFIELFQGELAERAEKQPFRHICLEVPDIHSTVRRLRERGVEVTDVKQGADMSYQAWLEDPDGNRIELHSYTAESKQTPYLE